MAWSMVTGAIQTMPSENLATQCTVGAVLVLPFASKTMRTLNFVSQARQLHIAG